VLVIVVPAADPLHGVSIDVLGDRVAQMNLPIDGYADAAATR
jgi:hypothetical protein